MKRPIFYDTETTGIRPERDHIIEIAAYDPVQDRTFEALINPGCPIPPEATAIHKITDEMVADKPSFKEIGAQFAAFCEGNTVLIAHNNDSFDLPFLKSSFKRHELHFPTWEFLDSLRWARRYRPDMPRHTLQHLREAYGIPPNNAHRALDDVIVLHQVFAKMTDDLSIEMCLQLLSSPKLLRTMPFGKHQGKPLTDVPKDYFAWLKEQGALDKPGNEELKMSLEKLALI
ncbi:MAG: DUF3820 family protein [Chlamydiales bacterium]|nr:DUF3820 family protein [Chlamydiales bacterium]